jgi:hypothetical protein
MTYLLYQHGSDEPPQSCATLAGALEASGVPSCCWNAVVSTHPDEICTFYVEPGVVAVPGGAQWIITAPGVAAEFCARERLAGSLPPIGATP